MGGKSIKLKKSETHKACQTCNKWQPIEAYELHVYNGRQYRRPACVGRCTELYDQRRAKRRAKPEHKEYHCLNRQGAKHKAMKKKSAAKFNATAKGKIVKKRADKKFRSTAKGMIHHRLQERWRAMANGKRVSSAKVLEWTGLKSSAEIKAWAKQHLPDGVDVAEGLATRQVEHIIPYFAFTFKRINGVLVRSYNISDDDMKRLWHPDNLTLLSGPANQEKNCKLPPDAVLYARAHCWPSWFAGRVPGERDKESMHRARYG